MDRSVLKGKQLAELREIAGALELKGYQRLRKADLIDLISGGADNGDAAAQAVAKAPAQPEPAPDEVPETAAVQADDATTDHVADELAGPDDDDDAPRGGGRELSSADRVRARRRNQTGGASEDGDGSDERPRTRDRQDRPERHERQERQDRPERQERELRERERPQRIERERPDRGEVRTDEQDHDRVQNDRGDNDRANDAGDEGSRSRNRNRSRKARNRPDRAPTGNSDVQNYDDLEVREGVLDLLPEGYGFLRTTGYLAGDRDVYVSQSFVRRFGLRRGDVLGGPVRFNKGNDKFPALARVDTLEGEAVEEGARPEPRVEFRTLTPLFPTEQLHLETDEHSPIAMRITDMLAPIGKGQRGLIVSPPKAGKTTVLKQLAKAIETNNPEVHLMVLLVDERPEEVTDFERSTDGEVISSTFDRPAEDHTQVAELCIERAKRLVERGRDVVILLDSITRLGRAYNLAAPPSGRVLSGGIDSAALYPPKRFFGAARNVEEGGSLTILATALVDTGSKMDEVIFEEFKGTGNMELRLDRRMEQKRVFPAIDVAASSTRREELLLSPEQLEAVWKLRRVLAQLEGGAALELLIDKLKATKSNAQFLAMIAKSNAGS